MECTIWNNNNGYIYIRPTLSNFMEVRARNRTVSKLCSSQPSHSSRFFLHILWLICFFLVFFSIILYWTECGRNSIRHMPKHLSVDTPIDSIQCRVERQNQWRQIARNKNTVIVTVQYEPLHIYAEKSEGNLFYELLLFKEHEQLCDFQHFWTTVYQSIYL